jgi:TolB protein
MDANGTNARPLTNSFDVRGQASWSPDGKWVAVAGNNGQGTYVFKVPVEGGTPLRLTDTVSYNPIWSPIGQMIVYSEPFQGGTFLAKAITPYGMRVPIPDIRVSYTAGTPYRFLPDGTELIFAKESAFVGVRDFYRIDLTTGQEQQLTHFKTGFHTRSFDVSADARQIVFDRLRENSDIVLFNLPR